MILRTHKLTVVESGPRPFHETPNNLRVINLDCLSGNRILRVFANSKLIYSKLYGFFVPFYSMLIIFHLLQKRIGTTKG